MQKASVIFDLDGTLTDSGPGIKRAAAYAFKQMHYPVPMDNQLDAFVGPPLNEVFARFSIPDNRIEEAIEQYRVYYSEKGKYENTVYEGIIPLLKNLRKKGHTLYIGTTKPTELSIEILKHFDLYQYFQFVAGATLDHTREKKGDVLRYLLHKEPIDKAVMIGDTIYDVIGAKEVNIPSIAVSWGYGNDYDMVNHGATLVHTPYELEQAINQIR